MSKSDSNPSPAAKRAVALRYDDASAPVVVASGMGYLAEKIVEVAADSGVPVYEDNSLATILSQLQLGQEIPPELYQAIVEIYVYFLQFNPSDPDAYQRHRTAQTDAAEAQRRAAERAAAALARAFDAAEEEENANGI